MRGEKCGKLKAHGDAPGGLFSKFFSVLSVSSVVNSFWGSTESGLPREAGQSLFASPVTPITICDTENVTPVDTNARMR